MTGVQTCALPISLPRETVECVLNPEDAFCGICESELKVIGKKKVRSEMEYIPAKLVMKDYVQFVYKCPDCSKTDEHPEDFICSAPVPYPVLTHSIASPSTVAYSVTYNTDELEVVDLCAATARRELTAGAVQGTDIIIDHFEPGVIIFRINRTIPPGTTWSGVVNSIRFRAKISGQATITCVIN